MSSLDFVICNNCKRETYQGFGNCLYCGYDVISNVAQTRASAGPAHVDGDYYDENKYRIVKAKSLLPAFVITGIIGIGIALAMVSNATVTPDSTLMYYLQAFLLGGVVGALLFG